MSRLHPNKLKPTCPNPKIHNFYPQTTHTYLYLRNYRESESDFPRKKKVWVMRNFLRKWREKKWVWMFEYFPSIWNEKAQNFHTIFWNTLPRSRRSCSAWLRRGERESSLRGWEREQTSILEGQNNNYESMTEQKIAETGHQKDLHSKVQSKINSECVGPIF